MTHTTKSILFASLLLSFAGCTTTPPDDGVGGGREELTSAETAAVLTSVSYVARAVDSVATRAEAARAGAEPMPVPDEPTPITGEPAPVDEPGAGACTTFEWSVLDPLRLTVHFDECVTPSGERIDGSVTAWLEYEGTSGAIGVALDDLEVGAHGMGGFVILSGDAATEAVLIEADLYLASPEGTVALVLDAAFTAPGGALTLDGSASFEKDDGDDWTAVATAVQWADPAACHPTSGALDLSATGFPPTHVTLREHDMLVQVGTLPAFPYPYLPCP
jgi:hypothetical protein